MQYKKIKIPKHKQTTPKHMHESAQNKKKFSITQTNERPHHRWPPWSRLLHYANSDLWSENRNTHSVLANDWCDRRSGICIGARIILVGGLLQRTLAKTTIFNIQSIMDFQENSRVSRKRFWSKQRLTLTQMHLERM